MKIAILGYGKEGKAAEAYFRAHRDEQGRENEIEIISPFEAENFRRYDLARFDLLMRSPSVPPLPFWSTGEEQGSAAEFDTRLLEPAEVVENSADWAAETDRAIDLAEDLAVLVPKMSSGTRYFFDHCPAPIIGVTGTKGKGTTCSMIADILRALGRKVFLLGNIGVPALSELDKISKDDVVVFEMSSFQLWDIEKSPHIAVILRLEPDHLNVHRGLDDYYAAKGRIAEFQGSEDSVVYFRKNQNSAAQAAKGQGRKIAYPVEQGSAEIVSGAEKAARRSTGENAEQGSAEFATRFHQLLDALTVPGEHNRENAEAALLAVAAFLGVGLPELVEQNFAKLQQALHDFKGLPHHIEFVRNLNGVDYYDDSFATNEPSLEVALKSFAGRPLILIAGGQDKKVDYTPIKRLIFGTPNLRKAILLGEIKGTLAAGEDPEKATEVETLAEAVQEAQKTAEAIAAEMHAVSKPNKNAPDRKQGSVTGSDTRFVRGPVVLLSPGAASLDMFESYYQRGDLFKEYVNKLK